MYRLKNFQALPDHDCLQMIPPYLGEAFVKTGGTRAGEFCKDSHGRQFQLVHKVTLPSYTNSQQQGVLAFSYSLGWSNKYDEAPLYCKCMRLLSAGMRAPPPSPPPPQIIP